MKIERENQGWGMSHISMNIAKQWSKIFKDFEKVKIF